MDMKYKFKHTTGGNMEWGVWGGGGGGRGGKGLKLEASVKTNISAQVMLSEGLEKHSLRAKKFQIFLGEHASRAPYRWLIDGSHPCGLHEPLTFAGHILCPCKIISDYYLCFLPMY